MKSYLGITILALGLASCGSASEPDRSSDASVDPGDAAPSPVLPDSALGDDRAVLVADLTRATDQRLTADQSKPKPDQSKPKPDSAPAKVLEPIPCTSTLSCTPVSEVCCEVSYNQDACVAPSSCKSTSIACTSSANCPGAQVCCYDAGKVPIRVTCETSCAKLQLCKTSSECLKGTCQTMGTLSLKVCM